jgi:hypothetical protein
MVYQVKALGVNTNSRAELNDLYGSVVNETLNLERNFYNALPKVANDSDRFGFRVRTAANPTADSYAELDVIGTGNATRQKHYVDMKLVKVGVEVSGLEIASARGAGGIGDIWAEEMRVAAEDFAVEIDTQLCAGAAPASSNDMTGLQYLVDSTGVYFDVADRAAAGYEWACANEDNTSEDLSITRMRQMIKTNVVDGANKANLVFWTHPTQLDKYKDLIQDLQRTVPVSARVGYEGEAALDGVPIMTDIRITESELFCLDMGTMKLAVLQPPIIAELPEPKDARAAFIKMYAQAVCTLPKVNYKKTALST